MYGQFTWRFLNIENLNMTNSVSLNSAKQEYWSYLRMHINIYRVFWINLKLIKVLDEHCLVI